MNFKKYFKNKKINEVLTRDLTPRESQIIRLIALGNDIEDIIKIFPITLNTVKKYLSIFSLKLIPETKPTNLRVAICNFYWSYSKEVDNKCEIG